MKNAVRISGVLLILILFGIVSGCATVPPAPYYDVRHNYTPGDSQGGLSLGPNDQNYIILVEDRTPFGLRDFPQTEELLYNMGYDHVRRKKDADFSIDVMLSAAFVDNPDVRAGNTVGGALVGAATGAIIGGALGEPGAGAAIGAASGGALGMVAPADTPQVRIDISVYSFTDQASSQKSVTVDLSSVPPHDVQHVIDNEVSRMLRSLPRR